MSQRSTNVPVPLMQNVEILLQIHRLDHDYAGCRQKPPLTAGVDLDLDRFRSAQWAVNFNVKYDNLQV